MWKVLFVASMEKKSAMTRVQSLAESGIQTVPPQYVRPTKETFNNSCHAKDVHIPVIDLHGLDVQPLTKAMVDEISSAAEEWGFFQVVNHGIPESLIARVQAVGKAFFDLPMEEKEIYKNGGGSHVGYGTKLGTSADAPLNWRDFYYNIVWPVSLKVLDKWPKQPSDFTLSILLFISLCTGLMRSSFSN